MRTHIEDLFETPPPLPTDSSFDPLAEDVIHAFGILGMVGPPDESLAGRMTTNFATWIFLVSHMRGYHTNRSTWHAIRPLCHLFPEGHVIFGEAGCDRLQLPLPSLDIDANPTLSAKHFVTRSLLSLQRMVQKVKPSEKLVLLLIGHGDLVAGEFRFLVTTQTGSASSESYITKGELECALEHCQGEVLLICNSCLSGHLVSEQWTLLCAAAPDEEADLQTSSSCNFRGSVPTACVVAQAAREHGWQLPLLQALRRPIESSESQLVPLPPSAPPHSFSAPAAAPSTISVEEFMCRMRNMGQFLVQNHSTASWNKIFPIEFTAAIMSVNPTPATFSTTFNEICPTRSAALQLEGEVSPSLGSQSPQFNPLLVKLATYVRQLPFTHNAVFAQLIADLRRHIVEPEQYANPLHAGSIGEEPLLVVLRSTHVQALAVQHIARELCWCSPTHEVTSFLPQQIENCEFQKMIKKGIRVDKLPYYLKRYHFYDYPYVQHCIILQLECDYLLDYFVQVEGSNRS